MTRDRERYAIPFFFRLDADAIIGVLPTWCGSEHPPHYDPVHFCDDLAERLAAKCAHARDNG